MRGGFENSHRTHHNIKGACNLPENPLTQELLTLWIETYKDMVYRIIISRVKHPSDADDIFQEVFVKAVRFGQTLAGREPEHVKHWLIRVTLQQCSTWLQRRKRVETDSYEENLESGKWGGETREPHTLMPGDERTSLREENLMEALKRLSPDHRTVIFLYYYEQLSVQKIAAILGRNENAVKQRLHNARKKLRMWMNGGAYCEGRV